MSNDTDKHKIPFIVKAGIVIAVFVAWSLYSDEQKRIESVNQSIELKNSHEEEARLRDKAPILPPAYRFLMSVEEGDEDTAPNIIFTLETFVVYPDGHLDNPGVTGKLDKNVYASKEKYFDFGEYESEPGKPIDPLNLLQQNYAISLTISFAKKDILRLSQKDQLSNKGQLFLSALKEAIQNDFYTSERLPQRKGFVLKSIKFPLEKAVKPS